jgi:dsRNA-specific ribonuclease
MTMLTKIGATAIESLCILNSTSTEKSQYLPCCRKKCRLEEEKGPAHRGIFLCSVHVETEDGNFNELGDYRSRLKDAEKSAALNMFTKLAKE